ncbi:glycoside hydrolase family 16 protein [Aaosphaeria arxii CBS 175.79]|uniref:Glycoside hydrolase family 16 protein n=1 Tax=Aaosphaeria arxii CBS 175.79 TaxID=1450172 RepID=A0A6A5XK21_9PLEO|nr:glycoside hydrolase family 16 protein [Aaosphaeria arxii CBS 175.79]KAF2013191.1 glycoside hydrolase family 16 protein [Aaosphaeria arxii CBS 175.79]
MMHLVACSVLLTHLAKVQAQQYELIRSYTPENFFDEFEFFTGADPTGGFVQFVPYETAAVSGLVDNSSNQIHLGVDHVNNYVAGGLGRQSVRVQSKMAFTEGLFIADLLHIPTGCGTWPAFWTVGLGDWPTDGEIDIVENVNDATSNNAALHAAGDCAVNPLSGQTGTWKSTDCNIAHDGNQGCGTNFTEPNNYGLDFNANGGGIYAMEWTKSFINIWFFPPENIPQSLNSTSFMSPDIRPDPDTFGPPSASFWGPCSASFGDKFFNHSIVFDTTFCGGWAGNTFGTGGSQCPLLAGATPLESCVNYVANSPQSFTDAYWSIRSLTVWQKYNFLFRPGKGARPFLH